MKFRLFKITSLVMLTLETLLSLGLSIYIAYLTYSIDYLIPLCAILIFLFNLLFLILDIKSIHNKDYIFQPLVFNDNGSINKKFILILCLNGILSLSLLVVAIYFIIINNLSLFLLFLICSIFLLSKIIIFVFYIYNYLNDYNDF